MPLFLEISNTLSSLQKEIGSLEQGDGASGGHYYGSSGRNQSDWVDEIY